MNLQTLMLKQNRIIAIKNTEIVKPESNTAEDAVKFICDIYSKYGWVFSKESMPYMFNEETRAEIQGIFDTALGSESVDSTKVFHTVEESRTIDELEHYLHQLVNYLGTYGLGIEGEYVLEHDASKGDGKQAQDFVLDDAVKCVVMPYDKAVDTVLTGIFSSNKPVTDMQIKILSKVSPENLVGRSMAFKANLETVFHKIVDAEGMSLNKKVAILSNLCQHTGDVLKCIHSYLSSLKKERYQLSYAYDSVKRRAERVVKTDTTKHLTTHKKKVMVRVLDSYSSANFRENIIRTGSVREETIKDLNFISYASLSQNQENKKSFEDLKAGKLRSWESSYQSLLDAYPDEAVKYASHRPGFLIRNFKGMLKRGASIEAITDALMQNVDNINMRVLVDLKGYFATADLPESEQQYKESIVNMLDNLLEVKYSSLNTPLKGKKVYIDFEEHIDVEHSLMDTMGVSYGEYLRSGLAYKIPESAETIRFFTYWNDPDRVDIDLHAELVQEDGISEWMGWNQRFRTKNIAYFSGDRTQSDSAEYIDVDIQNAVNAGYLRVYANIQDFTRKKFSNIETVLVGITAVSEISDKDMIYDPKNCIFSNYLKMPVTDLNYGIIDLANRYIRLSTSKQLDTKSNYCDLVKSTGMDMGMTLAEYLTNLLIAQEVEIVDNKEDAEICLCVEKPEEEKYVSLIDNNFFLDC